MFVKKTLCSLLVILSIAGCAIEQKMAIDLSGTWDFRLDPDGQGKTDQWFKNKLPETVVLPGTLDENEKGNKSTAKPELTKNGLMWLNRKYSYTGPAWFQRQITVPQKWAGKRVTLSLERALWETSVWINGNKAGSKDSLVTAHVYDISKWATPGRHTLTICVDNSYKYNVGSHSNHPVPLGHAYTDHTQTIWNGVIGQMKMTAQDRVYVDDVKVYPDVEKGIARLKVKIASEFSGGVQGQIAIGAKTSNTSVKHSAETVKVPFSIESRQKVLQVDYPMGKGFITWDEFTPAVYDLTVECSAKSAAQTFSDSKVVSFGMREFGGDKDGFTINGRKVFLRGTLECCIFPLTGHPPMSVEEWGRIYKVAKSYGLNHFRFHSWCPPEAAFAAADLAGFYLQPEAPVWIPDAGKDKPRDEFMRREAFRIIDDYGNHPSFCLMSMGNELSGDFSFLQGLVKDLQDADPRHLYTSTTFSFQGEHGKWPEQVDDFFISQQTKKGWIRGQGFFNQRKPATDYDFSDAVEGINVPVVSHEIGQYTVYPKLDEIEKYTGVLEPLNFIAIKNDIESKGLLGQAGDFTSASGRFGVELYKAEIEAAFRTEGLSGFQLLDIHDFPGQGTAVVGVLDAFWDSKGQVTGGEFSRFCAATVPLLRISEHVYSNHDTFKGDIEVVHFGKEAIRDANINWSLKAGSVTIAEGKIGPVDIGIGRSGKIGEIETKLDSITKAVKVVVEVEIEGAGVSNDWNIWVYPVSTADEAADNVVIANTIDEKVDDAISNGGKVLLVPKPMRINDRKQGCFVPVFWSPVHFTNQPGTMGILCDPEHPALSDFPTEFHSNWQWWDLNINSAVIKISQFPAEIKPIVQVVDNFTRNAKLATVFEIKVGKADVLICSIDINGELENRHAARQLRKSLLEYIKGGQFNPQVELSEEKFRGLLREGALMLDAKVVYTDSAAPQYDGFKAIDDNPNTMWHTSWDSGNIKYPHEIQIDIGKEVEMTGVVYTPRQDGDTNGLLKDYEVYLSKDGKNWGKPAAKGRLERNAAIKKIMFDWSYQGDTATTARKGRYVRLVGLSGFEGDKFLSMAGFDVITD